MKTIVLDIGGVIFPDIWESIFLTPKRGLFNKFNIEISNGKKILKDIWKTYSILSTDNCNWKELEYCYWEDVLKRLNIKSKPLECIKYSIPFIKPYSAVEKKIKELLERKWDLIICSNQTAFWFKRQLIASNILNFIPSNKMVLSFDCGFTKDDDPIDMFKLVEKKAKNSINKVLYIDDRLKNVRIAKKYGFLSKKFIYKDKSSILKLNNIIYHFNHINYE